MSRLLIPPVCFVVIDRVFSHACLFIILCLDLLLGLLSTLLSFDVCRQLGPAAPAATAFSRSSCSRSRSNCSTEIFPDLMSLIFCSTSFAFSVVGVLHARSPSSSPCRGWPSGPSSLRGLLARHDTGVRAVAAGWSRRWALGCACGASPARRLLAVVAARACCCATFRSLAERGAAFLARSARSMSAALSRRSLCTQQRRSGALVPFASEAAGSSPTDMRRGLRRGSEPASTRLHIERRAWRCERRRSKRRVTAGRSARLQGLRKQGRSHRFITAGCPLGRVAPPLQRNAIAETGRSRRFITAGCASRRRAANAIAEKHHGSGALGPHRRREKPVPRVSCEIDENDEAPPPRCVTPPRTPPRAAVDPVNKAAAAPAPREGARLPPPQTERGQELPARVAPTVGAVRRRVVARRLSAKGLRAEPPAHQGPALGGALLLGRRRLESVRERPFRARSWARRSSGAAMHLTSTSTPAASARTARRRSAPTCAIRATARASSCGCA